MKYWYQKPNPALSPYVRNILVLEGFTTSGTDSLPLFTNGMPALFCRTEKESAAIENVMQLTLFGNSIPTECLSVNPSTTVIVCFFKPFVLTCLFNVAASRLKETPLDLSAWDSHKTNALRTQLSYAKSTADKIAVLDHLILHQLQQTSRECEIVRYATDYIMNHSGTEILPELLKKLDLHERTFQRIFKKYVGITANQYRRICQFQLSFAQVRSQKFDQLTDVAYDHGFADQSHFIRTFKEFTQTTPNNYLRFGLKDKK